MLRPAKRIHRLITSICFSPSELVAFLIFLITFGNVPRSPKKQVPGSDSFWQHPPSCWSMEMCYPSRSFWGDTMVPADHAMTMTTFDFEGW